MNNQDNNSTGNYTTETEDGQLIEPVKFNFSMSRRGFVQALGAGIVIATTIATGLAQQRGGRGARGGGGRGGFGGFGGAANIDARLHIGQDGIITVMTGKVEGGQGARAQITQAAAEELRVPIDRVTLVMGDTDGPDDGGTYGSQTTPRTLPAVRAGCAAARLLLLDFAAKQWNVGADTISVRDGAAVDAAGNRTLGYAQLAAADAAALKGAFPQGVTVTAVEQWKIQGVSTPRPNAHDMVNGRHLFPSAIIRPGMLYGKVLRAPAYGATIESVDLAQAKAMDGVVVVQDGNFIGAAAPTTYLAKKAIAAIQKTAKWNRPANQPGSADVPKYLRENAAGGVPASPFTDEINAAGKALKAGFDVAYVQHAPMEPRAAVAEWIDGRLTVWTASQNPFAVKNELAGAMRIPAEQVRVIIPDFGGGFGGKHTGETAVEAARLARAAGKPVAMRWTREEEFTWAAFRPAAAIDIHASLDASGKITSWHYVAINNPYNAAAASPYNVGKSNIVGPQIRQVLRVASYRALGAPANVFARESFMDELALAAGKDPLAFRLAHLENPRLRAVLEDAAKRFDWTARRAKKEANVGVGLACGIDKDGFVATCAEVEVDPINGRITVRHIAESFECGAIVNPSNLYSQVQGGIIQAIGPALREAMDFQDGVMVNASLFSYKVPRFADVPTLDINLLNRPDLPSSGAGECPLIAVAPAIANAVRHATGVTIRKMPLGDVLKA